MRGGWECGPGHVCAQVVGSSATWRAGPRLAEGEAARTRSEEAPRLDGDRAGHLQKSLHAWAARGGARREGGPPPAPCHGAIRSLHIIECQWTPQLRPLQVSAHGRARQVPWGILVAQRC